MSGRPFRAVNLISDPIHGYIELTKRLSRTAAAEEGLLPEESAEEDLLDTAWLQRLRRISQLQSARWVFPTAEHSRFTHGLGVMHEAGLWARHLYPSLRTELLRREPDQTPPSEGLVVETLRVAGLVHDVGHGPFAHFFDDRVLAAFPAPADPRRRPGKSLTHEDLSQLIVERELGPTIRNLRRAPGPSPERDAFAPDEAIDPAWIAFLVSKPPLEDPGMPTWIRLLQPLLSGVFTVDNLDYVRRDAYMTGVAVGPVDVERLRRYCFIGPRGLTIYEPGVAALEVFLGARLYMYQQVYLHRTVRAIDLDLREVFGPSIRAIAGERSPADDLAGYANLDEYALLHQAALWARGEAVASDAVPGDGRVAPGIAAVWRGILLRRPRWRTEAELRLEFEGTLPDDALEPLAIDAVPPRIPSVDRATAGRSGTGGTLEPVATTAVGASAAGSTAAGATAAAPGPVEVDAAVIDARPYDGEKAERLLAIETRDGSPTSVARALARLPANVLVARRYRRIHDIVAES